MPVRASYHSIDTWVFDLDNTLYPPDCGVFDQVQQRMGQFIADRFQLAPDAARAMQKDYFRRYGTTLIGLMREHKVPAEDYLGYVHDIDLSGLPDGAALRDRLAALPGRRIIYTNASAQHAGRVMERLGIADLFDGIFDIWQADFVPKPEAAPFDQFLDRFAIDPGCAVFVEDMARNLVPAYQRGLRTVWLRNRASLRLPPDAETDSHIDEAIDDLLDWLDRALLASQPPAV